MEMGLIIWGILFVIGLFVDQGFDAIDIIYEFLVVITLAASGYVFYTMGFGLVGIVIMSIIATAIVIVGPIICKELTADFDYDSESASTACWVVGIMFGLLAALVAAYAVDGFGIGWLSVISFAIPLVTAIISTNFATDHLDGRGLFPLIGWFLFTPLMVVAVAVAIIGTILLILGLLVFSIISIIVAICTPPTVVGVILLEG